MNELLKGSISLIIAFMRVEGPSPAPRTIDQPAEGPLGGRAILYRMKRVAREVFSPDCWKLSIPAILYGKLVSLNLGHRDPSLNNAPA